MPNSLSSIKSQAPQHSAEWLASEQGRIDVDREICRRSMIAFVRKAWHILEPSTPYVEGWVLYAICDHLMAVSRGEISRLLINVPPGMMKSLLVSVFWTAWEWGPLGAPGIKTITASYQIDLAIRDARRLRMLVESEWFQARWPLAMASDQNQKTRFENVKTGFRAAKPITSLTGDRGHRLIIDDPHSIKTAESDAQRNEAVREFREAAPSRMVDPTKSAIVVIMQRIHQGDVSGEIIDRIGGYEKLILPMEYDVERPCTTSIGFKDPRTEDGELLFPERFPAEVVERDKAVLGLYASAGQFQQAPSPRAGGLFIKSKVGVIAAVPAGSVRVRKWDLAGTEKGVNKKGVANDPDFTVGLLMAKTTDGRSIVEDVVRLQASPFDVEQAVLRTAQQDRAAHGNSVVVHLNIDPAQAGIHQANTYTKLLNGFIVKMEPERGSKEYRAFPVAAQVEAGNVFMVPGLWNAKFLEEIGLFPQGRYKDQVDALSGAYNFMNNPMDGQHFWDWMMKAVAEQEAAKAEARAEAPVDRVPMHPPVGVLSATGRMGDGYNLDKHGVMWVKPDDALIFARAGFRRVEIQQAA
jgi:predicted phage terminase large subunit-like protein